MRPSRGPQILSLCSPILPFALHQSLHRPVRARLIPSTETSSRVASPPFLNLQKPFLSADADKLRVQAIFFEPFDICFFCGFSGIISLLELARRSR